MNTLKTTFIIIASINVLTCFVCMLLTKEKKGPWVNAMIAWICAIVWALQS